MLNEIFYLTISVFTGINPETEQPTVGFRIASYREGSMCVAPIEHLCHLPDPMKKVVKVGRYRIRQVCITAAQPVLAIGELC